MMAWKAPAANQPSPVASSLGKLDAESEEEYLRLLYVGMTRAEDRLYLCGFAGVRGPAENCWYEVARRALSDHLEEVPHPVTGDPIHRWHLEGRFQERPVDNPKPLSGGKEAPDLPAWITQPASKPPSPMAFLQPSKAAEKIEGDQGAMQLVASGPSRSLVHDWEPRRRGAVIHALIEHLPQVSESERQKAGLAYLSHVAKDMSLQSCKAILEEVLQLLSRPELAALFSPQGLAEVSIAGMVTIHGEEHTVSGQIDRLLVGKHSVTIVDYKTNRLVPQSPEEAPLAYRTQMALYARLLAPLYPGKTVETLLLWTAEPSIMAVPEALRQSALDEIGVNRPIAP